MEVFLHGGQLEGLLQQGDAVVDGLLLGFESRDLGDEHVDDRLREAIHSVDVVADALQLPNLLDTHALDGGVDEVVLLNPQDDWPKIVLHVQSFHRRHVVQPGLHLVSLLVLVVLLDTLLGHAALAHELELEGDALDLHADQATDTDLMIWVGTKVALQGLVQVLQLPRSEDQRQVLELSGLVLHDVAGDHVVGKDHLLEGGDGGVVLDDDLHAGAAPGRPHEDLNAPTAPVIHRELHCRRKPRCHVDDVAVLDVVVEHLMVDEVAVDAEPRDVVVAMLDVVLHEAHRPEDLLCRHLW